MNTAPGLELQDLIISTLRAAAAVTALVDGVYDKPPSNPWGGLKQAYITLGPTDVVIEDGDEVYGETHSIQVDVWSRKVGRVQCKQVVTAIKAALHDKAFTLPSNGFVEMLLSHYQILDDPDGLTTHGVMTFSAMIETDD